MSAAVFGLLAIAANTVTPASSEEKMMKKSEMSAVTIPGVNQSNGVIHVVDTVLMPAS